MSRQTVTEQTIAETLYVLRQQHRDLDQAIAALAAQPCICLLYTSDAADEN